MMHFEFLPNFNLISFLINNIKFVCLHIIMYGIRISIISNYIFYIGRHNG